MVLSPYWKLTDISTKRPWLTTIKVRIKQTYCCYPSFNALVFFLSLGQNVLPGSENTGEFVTNRINEKK